VADPFIAEIRIFAFNFAPVGWAFCDGQLLPIAQNTALFSLLGTTYGGDGRSNFALPNLQGMAPMQPDQGLHSLGDSGGATTETLAMAEMPTHTHNWQASDQTANDRTPAGEYLGRASGGNLYTANTSALVQMDPQTISMMGGGQAHNNMQPYLTLNFCIAMQGVFPPRT
jgi:microcystin-dependent protein